MNNKKNHKKINTVEINMIDLGNLNFQNIQAFSDTQE